MSSMVMVESSKESATTVHCESCDDSVKIGKGFIDGQAAIQKHANSFPLHRKIVFLRRDTVSR